jgi:hypothetical protein
MIISEPKLGKSDAFGKIQLGNSAECVKFYEIFREFVSHLAKSLLTFLLKTHSVQNFYDILGLTPQATQPEIRAAYLRLARENHPDLHPEDVEGYTRRFQDINAAYTQLYAPEDRERFDRRWSHFQSAPPTVRVEVRKTRWEGPGEKYRKARGGRNRYFSRPSGFFGMR